MGIVNLPTYQSTAVEKPAPSQPNPEFQGLASLQTAQKNFYATLFEGAVQIAGSVIQKVENDQYSAKMKQIADGDATDLRNIEQQPITSTDPRMADVPENMRATPNLYLFQEQRKARVEQILSDIQIPKVRDALQSWAADRFVAQKDSLARFDFQKAKDVRAENLVNLVDSAIQGGNIHVVDDLLTLATQDGTITDAKRIEYADLARKDITKRNAYLQALSMGDAGGAWLANKDNLKFPGVNGDDHDMPLGDQESLIRSYNQQMTLVDEQKKKAQEANFVSFLPAIDTGLLNGKPLAPGPIAGQLALLAMIEDPKTDLSVQQRLSLRSMIDTRINDLKGPKPAGAADPWVHSDPRIEKALIDLRNDPAVSDEAYKAKVAALVGGDYQGLSRTDFSSYYDKKRPETPVSQAVTSIFNKATQGSYPLMSPQDAASARIALDKEIEAARTAKKPYSDTDIQARVKALMLPYEMANIKARMDKSVSVANQPTEDEKAQYKVWQEAMGEAGPYNALMKGGNYVFKGWEGNLQNIEAMQSLIDQGKTFGMADNPLLQPHIDSLRVEYGKMFQTWSGKPSELKQADGTVGQTLTAPKYGGRAVYGVKTLDGQNRLFTVKINPKTNDEEWYLFDPKTDATTLVTDQLKTQLFGGKK